MAELATQQWLNDKRLAKLFAVIRNAGGKARIAGGAVRNGLWNLPVSDIDIATTLLPDEVIHATRAAGLGVHPTGYEHGTITIVIDGLVVEVTTLRADIETDGRHAKVLFTTDWQRDASRRDFTINSLYCDLSGQVFEEIPGALADIASQTIRFVGNANARVREDYLRILRFYRFFSHYGKHGLDKEGLAACITYRDQLEQLSVERIQSELLKILTGPNCVTAIQSMVDCEILQRLIRFDGSIANLARLTEMEKQPDALRRLASLTSDISSLRLSKTDQHRFAGLSNPTPIDPDISELAAKILLYDLGPDRFTDAVIMNEAASNTPKDWSQLHQLPQTWPIPKFPLTGQDLLDIGLKPGKQLGDILHQLRNEWKAGNFSQSGQELLNHARKNLKPYKTR